MADIRSGNGNVVKPTLGLLGAAMNAMALIAPGAFLWITYQLQAAATAPNGASVAADIWPGIVVALVVAFLTAHLIFRTGEDLSGSRLCERHLFR